MLVYMLMLGFCLEIGIGDIYLLLLEKSSSPGVDSILKKVQ